MYGMSARVRACARVCMCVCVCVCVRDTCLEENGDGEGKRICYMSIEGVPSSATVL